MEQMEDRNDLIFYNVMRQARDLSSYKGMNLNSINVRNQNMAIQMFNIESSWPPTGNICPSLYSAVPVNLL